MRNLFDQYAHPENRLTHALLCCLDRDRSLLRDFVQWSVGKAVNPREIELHAQCLPGEEIEGEEVDAERRGLPDGCLSNGGDWALLIESKFQATVQADQIRRHIRTAEKRGLTDCTVLVLTVKPYEGHSIDRVVIRHWTEVYRWLHPHEKDSAWATDLRRYMEAAEIRGTADDYLTEGALTVFSGIPFGTKHDPYTYPQAKRLLQLLRNELLKDRRLVDKLWVDAENSGRGAITGRKADAVWDYLALVPSKGAVFTEFPHLTLGIQASRLEARVTVPNSIQPKLRKRMLGDAFEDFRMLVEKVSEGLLAVIKKTPKAVPIISVVQRHYLTQRATPVLDCSLRFDLRTALPHKTNDRVKMQPQWLQATYDGLRHRKSNLQFQIGVDFPYDGCSIVASPDIARVVADVWLACRPLLKIMLSPE